MNSSATAQLKESNENQANLASPTSLGNDVSDRLIHTRHWPVNGVDLVPG
jgi:hypothetical protein